MIRINKLINAKTFLNSSPLVLTTDKFNNEFQKRALYTAESLGIEGFLFGRERVKSQFITSADSFKAKMNEFVQENSTNMVFTEDLKNMVHMVEKTSEDVNLLEKMLKKFNSQNKEIRFGNFIFGPVILRLLYYLQDCDTALKFFKDPELSNMFDQLISYQILLDLLYEKERYQDVLDTFTIIQERKFQGGLYPKHAIVLAMAACYKLNTPEAFEYGIKLWKKIEEVGHVPMRKAATFLAGLALEQNSAHVTIEILGTIRQQQYVTVRNLKILALIKLGRVDDALPILRSVLEGSSANIGEHKHTFTKEVVEKTETAIIACKNEDELNEFNRLKRFLEQNGHIEEHKTLDDLLCTEIAALPPINKQSKDRNMLAASFNNKNNYNDNNDDNNNMNNNYSYRNRNNFQRNTVRNRPGLQDLY